VKPTRVLVPVPVELALAYDGRTWKLIPAPADWWLAECEATVAADTRVPMAPGAPHQASGAAQEKGGARGGN
jgi:hypothetical protein